MADPRFDREVRKELLRARAAFERAQLHYQVRDLRRAARPTQVAQSLWPGLSRLLAVGGPWSAIVRALNPRASASATLGSVLAAAGAASGLRGSRHWLPLALGAWAGWQAWIWWHSPHHDADSPGREDDDVAPPTED